MNKKEIIILAAMGIGVYILSQVKAMKTYIAPQYAKTAAQKVNISRMPVAQVAERVPERRPVLPATPMQKRIGQKIPSAATLAARRSIAQKIRDKRAAAQRAAVARKAAVHNTVARWVAARKAVVRKAAARKTPVHNTVARWIAARKAAARKPVVRSKLSQKKASTDHRYMQRKISKIISGRKRWPYHRYHRYR